MKRPQLPGGLRHRLGLRGYLIDHLGRPGAATFDLVGCLVVIAVAGAVAVAADAPLLAPSLGPTAILFFERPLRRIACPHNTLISNGAAIVLGWLSLVMFRLAGAPPVIDHGFTWRRVGAAAVAVALTSFFSRLLAAEHPPAGATTLIVALGILHTAAQLVALAGGFVLITIVGVAFNRAAGLDMPLWLPRRQ